MRRFRLLVIMASLSAMVCGCNTPSTKPTDDPRRDPAHSSAIRAERETLILDLRGRSVILEVSDDADERRVGLSGRTALGPDRGMIFVYRTAAVRSYWMQGCRIGLDIAYVDDEGEIFQIGTLEPPNLAGGEIRSLESTKAALFVIELEKGWFSKHDVAAGTKIVIDDRLRRLVASAAP